MLEKHWAALIACATIAIPAPCMADALNSTATTGDAMHTSNDTGTGPQGMGGWTVGPTGKQAEAILQTGLGLLTPGGLQKTRLSSFVKDAGGSADQIYGDEGDWGPPPFFSFTADHRIAAGGLPGGLSTGHGSFLPDAWGGDEFIGAEFAESGPNFATVNAPLVSAPPNMAPPPAEAGNAGNPPANVYTPPPAQPEAQPFGQPTGQTTQVSSTNTNPGF
jgi:hypothetical protein